MWSGPKLRCIKMRAKQIQDKQIAIPGFHSVSGNHSNLYRVALKKLPDWKDKTTQETLEGIC